MRHPVLTAAVKAEKAAEPVQRSLFDTADKQGKVHIEGEVINVTYFAQERDFHIINVRPDKALGYKESSVAVTGTGSVRILAGMRVRASGVMSTFRDKKQLKCDMIHLQLPTTLEGIISHLGSGVYPGIGPKLAQMIVSRFGHTTWSVIEHHPEKLAQVEGLGPKKLEKLVIAHREHKGTEQLMSFLQSHGIGAQLSKRVYKALGEGAMASLKKDPYLLTVVPLIGFKKADEFALSMGIAKDDPKRVMAYLAYLLEQAGNAGHTMMRQADALKAITKDLGVNSDLACTVIEQAIGSADKIIARDPTSLRSVSGREARFDNAGYLSLAGHYRAEVSFVNSVKRLSGGKARQISGLEQIDKLIDRCKMSHLDESQREAVATCLSNKISVITGRPGCGKTTVTKAIVEICERSGLGKISLCAPTGRAARRLAEATGRSTSTIHSLLSPMGGDGGFRYHASNPLDTELVVIDESSMKDMQIAAALFSAIPDSARVIMVGDSDQLPSVGAGNVLLDAMESGVIPVSRLNKIHRQAEGNPIIRAAHSIIEGKMPSFSRGPGFDLVQEVSPPQIVRRIEEVIRVLLKDGIARESIQVLAPMKRGDAGTEALNLAVREILNPEKPLMPKCRPYGAEFRLGDRVMQMKNNRELGISNGDLGHIRAIDNEDRELTVDFGDGRMVRLDFGDCDNLVTAYACTVHKSQGSEFPVVIMPMTTQHAMMLNRNIVYTGVTRAKQRVVIVGDPKALAIAVNDYNSEPRITGLGPLLSQSGLPKAASAAIEAAPQYAPARPDLASISF